MRLVVPLESAQPTGMGVAAAGIEGILHEIQAGYNPPAINRWFRRLNDAPVPGGLKMLIRIALVQVAPLFVRGRLIFASHHAPLWRTGRHDAIIHDLIALRHPGQHPWQARFFRWLLPRVMRSAERVVTISETMRRELDSLGVKPAGGIHVIASYSPRIEPRVGEGGSGGALAERLAARELLFVGANFPHKNLDLVVRAVELLCNEGETVRLTVFGCRRKIWSDRGLDLERLEASGRFRFARYASDAELEDAYLRVSALVYFSAAEGMGMPPLEAMARGCPAICSDIPALRETCGEAAFYVPVDAAKLASFLKRFIRGEITDEIESRRERGFRQITAYSRAALQSRWRAIIAGA